MPADLSYFVTDMLIVVGISVLATLLVGVPYIWWEVRGQWWWQARRWRRRHYPRRPGPLERLRAWEARSAERSVEREGMHFVTWGLLVATVMFTVGGIALLIVAGYHS